jgi:hypothetical protein
MKKKYSKALELLYELEDKVHAQRAKPNDDYDRGFNKACSVIGDDIYECILNIKELFGLEVE